MSQVITVPIIGAPPPPPPSGPFSDDFNRSDRLLAGDNGWVNTTGVGDAVSPFRIVSDTVQVLTDVGVGSYPILHVRNDGTPGVADVTMTFRMGSAAGSGPLGGFSSLVVCSNLGYSETVGFYFDGSSGTIQPYRNHRGAGTLEQPDNITWFNGGWSAWTVQSTLRGVYTDATKVLEIYQGGVKKASCDMHTSNFSTSPGDVGTELPSLTAMSYGGFWASSGNSQDILDDFICA